MFHHILFTSGHRLSHIQGGETENPTSQWKKCQRIYSHLLKLLQYNFFQIWTHQFILLKKCNLKYYDSITVDY